MEGGWCEEAMAMNGAGGLISIGHVCWRLWTAGWPEGEEGHVPQADQGAEEPRQEGQGYGPQARQAQGQEGQQG